MKPDVMSLLTVVGANKSYSGVPALIDVSIDIKIAQVHALMGENGAGKSTLIRIIAGVANADSVEIYARGQLVHIREPQDSATLGMRFIHQELNFVPELSVAENIFLGRSYPSIVGIFVNWNRLHDRAGELLAQIGITHINPKTPMARLSVGDRMLVRIASAFVGDEGLFGERSGTKVYVMDEPTASLTSGEVDLLFQVIRHLRDLGYGILYVSHRMDEIFEIADVVTVMRNGSVVATENISDVSQKDIIRLMTGREINDVYPPREELYDDVTLMSVKDLSTSTLKNISFNLRRGEILGVVGLRESGQSELLQALMGVDEITDGIIALDGETLTSGTPRERWRKGIAYVPKERRSEGLVMGRSVRENTVLSFLRDVSLGRIFLNADRERKLTDEMARSVRLKAKSTEQRVRELSGGNQQKVVFARALAKNPRILLLNEPTRGVDVGSKFDIYTLMRESSRQGTGIIVASSDLPEVIGMCDRVLIMREGKLATIVNASGLTEGDLLHLTHGDIEGNPDSMQELQKSGVS